MKNMIKVTAKSKEDREMAKAMGNFLNSKVDFDKLVEDIRTSYLFGYPTHYSKGRPENNANTSYYRKMLDIMHKNQKQ